MFLYIGDNNDVYAGAASANTYGPHLEDWIYWRTGTYTPNVNGVYMTLEKSPLLIVLGTAGKTNLFRCPLDRDDSDRTTYAQSGDGPYYYSYEFTSWDLNNNYSHGFTAIIDHAGGAHYVKSSQVRNPVNKIMVAEPTASLKPNDESPTQQQMGSTWIVQCGRWEPYDKTGASLINFMSVRHNRKADVTFADGHTAVIPWQLSTNLLYVQPDL